MIYELNKQTNEITETNDSEKVRRRLIAAGWKRETVSEFFRSAKVLSSATHYYCRFKNRLDEIRSGHEKYLCQS